MAILSVVVVPGQLSAQATDTAVMSDRGIWAGAGTGIAAMPERNAGDSSTSGSAGAGVLYVTYREKQNLITGRLSSTAEVFGDVVFDYGLLYGRMIGSGEGFVSVGGGLAFVEGEFVDDGLSFCNFFSQDCEPKETVKVQTVGVPLEVQLFWRPTRFVGVGAYLFANLNTVASFGGASASIQLGLFR